MDTNEQILELIAKMNADMQHGFEKVNSDMNERFDEVYSEMNSGFDKVYSEMNSGFDKVYSKMNGGFDKVNHDFDKVYATIQEEFNGIYAEFKDIRMTLENEISKNINQIAEGHSFLGKKLDDALKIENEKELMLIRITRLENELRRLKAQVKLIN